MDRKYNLVMALSMRQDKENYRGRSGGSGTDEWEVVSRCVVARWVGGRLRHCETGPKDPAKQSGCLTTNLPAVPDGAAGLSLRGGDPPRLSHLCGTLVHQVHLRTGSGSLRWDFY